MEKLRCVKCKHEWLPRVPNPKECPECKRRDWEAKSKEEPLDNEDEKEIEERLKDLGYLDENDN